MRLNDADELKTAFPACDNSKPVLVACVRATINHMPTIEPPAQPEIIRCGECKHHEDEAPGMAYCPIIVGGWVGDDWFCADGKRRQDETD